MRGYTVSYTSPRGDGFTILSPREQGLGRRPVNMAPEGLNGASAVPEVTDVDSVTRFGARQTSFKMPAIESTMPVIITNAWKSLEEQERQWRQAWSHFKDGRLTVADVAGQNRWAPARLASMPDVANALHRKRAVETAVTWRNLAGCWLGSTRRYFDTVTVLAPGDLPPSLRLKWDGSATSVGFPDGRTVNLPAISGTRFINLDYGFSGQVTFEHGLVDSVAWSQLRGLVSGLTLMPHEPASFVLGAGLSLEVTPRYLSPWG